MKGILFTELLFHKTVDGSKTMTRREGDLKKINDNPDEWHLCGTTFGGEWTKAPISMPIPDKFGPCELGFSRGTGLIGYITAELQIKPRYKVGEVVYIKEPYLHGVLNEDGDTYLVYKYDFTEEEREGYKWKNKLFMGEEYARHYIRITEVRVERLFDISDEDCIKEGIDIAYTSEASYGTSIRAHLYKDYMDKTGVWCLSPEKSFFSLFRFANKIPKSKELQNVWTFVYEYHLCDKEGNKL